MKRTVTICCLVLLAAGAIARADEALRIVPIVHDDTVLISFELEDAFSDGVREVISSGLRTTFTYDVALRMHVAAWVDRTVATAVVSNSDVYDNLTRRHHLTRTVDGRVEDTLDTEDEAVATRWLTTVSRFPICRTTRLDPTRDYYVRVSAQVRPQHGSIIGWASAITGSARFTFIP